MRRKFTTVALASALTLALTFTGCGKSGVVSNDKDAVSEEAASKDEDAADKDEDVTSEEKETTAEVDAELEKKYVARIDAYKEYFNQYDRDNRYETSASISLDENKLPIMWLLLDDVNGMGNGLHITAQLVSYDDESGKVRILAQSRTLRCRSVGTYVTEGVQMLSTIGLDEDDNGDELLLIYDEENKKFVEREHKGRETAYEIARDTGRKLGWDDEEFLEKGKEIFKSLKSKQYYYSDLDTKEIVFVAEAENYAFDVLYALGAIDGEMVRSPGDDGLGEYSENLEGIYSLFGSKYINNEKARELYRKAFIFDDIPNEWKEKIDSIKEYGNMSKDEFLESAEGTTDEDYEEYKEFMKFVDKEGMGYYNYNCNLKFANGDIVPMATEDDLADRNLDKIYSSVNGSYSCKKGLDFTAILNNLSNKPAYTVGELCTVIAGGGNYTRGEYSEAGMQAYLERKYTKNYVEKFSKFENEGSSQNSFAFFRFDGDAKPEMLAYVDDDEYWSCTLYTELDGNVEPIVFSNYDDRQSIFEGGYVFSYPFGGDATYLYYYQLKDGKYSKIAEHITGPGARNGEEDCILEEKEVTPEVFEKWYSSEWSRIEKKEIDFRNIEYYPTVEKAYEAYLASEQ